MVTTSKAMSTAQAGSYYEKDNYYIKDGMTEKGSWYGDGAQELGLNGDIDFKDFNAVLEGKDPRTGEQIIPDGTNKKGEPEHRAGFDMTTSAPKSVSILALVEGKKEVLEAHHLATKTMLEYAEKELLQAREWNGVEQVRVDTGMMVASQFTHYTARAAGKNIAPDPQLHTHNFIANMTLDTQGKWKATEPNSLYKNQAMLGQVYQNALSKEMERLGYQVEWTRQKNGNYTFEVKGMDKEIEHYSKRSISIKEHIALLEAEQGRKLTAAEKEIAKSEIRASKEKQDLDKLKEDWQQQAKEKGLNTNVQHNSIETQTEKKEIETIIKNAVYETEKYDSIMDKTKILHQALKEAQGKYSLDELKAALDENKEVFKMSKHEYGTKELLQKEKDIINKLKTTENTMQSLAAEKDVEKFLSKEKTVTVEQLEQGIKGMKADQKEFIKTVLTSQDQVMLVQGDAGTGKTHAIAKLKEYIVKNNIDVEIVGLAPTGKAADELQNKAGINSQTIDKFLLEKEGRNTSFQKEDIKNLGFSAQEAKWLTKETTKAQEELKTDIMHGASALKRAGIRALYRVPIGRLAVRTYNFFSNERSYHKDGYVDFDGTRVFKSGKMYSTLSQRLFGLNSGSVHNTIKIDKLGNITKTTTKIDKIGNMTFVSNKNGHITAAFKPAMSKEWTQLKANDSKKQKLYIIDESSMLSTKKMHDLQQKIGKDRVVFVGDKKQLKAVEQGSMFEKMQKVASSFVNMTEKTRQKNEQTKGLVKDFERGDIRAAFERLQSDSKLIEQKNITKLKEQFVKDVSQSMVKDGVNSTIAITAKNEERKEFNESIRKELVKAGTVDKNGIKAQVLEQKKLTDFDKTQISSYKEGDVLKSGKHMGNVKAGTELTITKIDKENKTMEVSFTVKDQEKIKATIYKMDSLPRAAAVQQERTVQATINIERASKFDVYNKRDLEISKNDKIMFTKNDKDFKNGQTGIITDIKENTAQVKLENGKVKEFDITKNKHFDHGYTMTAHKTQGMDINKGYIYSEVSKSQNRNSGHVEATRVKDEARYYTNDKEQAIRNYEKEQEKHNITDKLNNKDHEKSSHQEQPKEKENNQDYKKDTKDSLKDEIEKLKGNDKSQDQEKNIPGEDKEMNSTKDPHSANETKDVAAKEMEKANEEKELTMERGR